MFARPRPQSPFICLRCLRKASLSQTQIPRHSPSTTRPQRRPFTSSTTFRSSNNPPPPPPSGVTALPHRRLISLSGRDAAKFLQGLTTNNVSPFATTGWYTAFLNAQGRVLYDCFVYPASSVRGYREWLSGEGGGKGGDGLDWGCFIEVDGSVLEEVTKHLKRHKLRSKVNIRLVGDGEWGVWAAWDDAAPSASSHSEAGAAGERRGIDRSSGDSIGHTSLSDTSTSLIHIPDSRTPKFGHRIVSTQPPTSSSLTLPPPLEHLKQTPTSSYHLRRLLHGIPEGPSEIPPSSALPLEHNMDLMSGIDFRKGCYVGQELTIRTKHTGVVRKRVLPVQLYGADSAEPQRLEYDPEWAGPSPPKDADIKGFDALSGGRKGRAAGKFITAMSNVGLAMCRLEMMTDIRLTAESAGAGAHVPGTEFGIKWVVDDPQEGQEGGREEVVKIKAFVPDWHKERGWEGKVQRRVG
ncbi:ccr4 associated factor [Coniosporium apollinis]|uniref:Iron-sulfur cluster assembly factor IBA57 homolog, mitochondrial n=1 Tax=Coniosporium apollinis TaxID=61459 RepID=A0ABQ9NPG1_9PEZI|nr:ccr4 associated factor [Coniosporium apollinis]